MNDEEYMSLSLGKVVENFVIKVRVALHSSQCRSQRITGEHVTRVTNGDAALAIGTNYHRDTFLDVSASGLSSSAGQTVGVAVSKSPRPTPPSNSIYHETQNKNPCSFLCCQSILNLHDE